MYVFLWWVWWKWIPVKSALIVKRVGGNVRDSRDMEIVWTRSCAVRVASVGFTEKMMKICWALGIEYIVDMIEAQLSDSVIDVQTLDGIKVDLTNMLSGWQMKDKTDHLVLKNLQLPFIAFIKTGEPGCTTIVYVTLQKGWAKIFPQLLVQVMCMPVEKSESTINLVDNRCNHDVIREILVECNSKIFNGILSLDDLIFKQNLKRVYNSA